MKVLASIQARLGSSRLPGKVLKPIAGVPMLLRHVDRLRRSRLIDEVVVATTTNPSDDAIAAACRNHGVDVFRGSEDDVLGRIAALLRERRPDAHVECYGDSPLTDAHLLDEVIGLYLKNSASVDFVSNALKTTYPPGQEAVCYRADALIAADGLVDPGDPLREHVSLNIWKRPERFRVMSIEAPAHYRRPDLFLEVDTAEDFAVVSAVFEHFLARGQAYFSLAQILDFFSHREDLAAANRGIERRWKQFREEDR